jgi:hypothetical protein
LKHQEAAHMHEGALRAMRCLGIRVADQTLKRQIPLIAQEFPEIAHCHYGTINFALQLPLIVAVSDYRTKPIHWKDNLVSRFGLGLLIEQDIRSL